MTLGSLHITLSTLLGFGLPVLAFAQTDTGEFDETPIQTVIVKANPLGREADDLVQPTRVLSGEELDRRRGGTIGELLENQPGVANSDFGPGVGRPIIRGQGGARVAVLENGIGAMDVSTLSNDHAVSIDPASAEQVEIIKGPATLIYGSAASGGVVNLVNGRLADEFRQGLAAEGELTFSDNADGRSQRIELDYGLRSVMLHADYAGREANNLEIPGNAFVDGSAPVDGEVPNSALKTRSGAMAATWFGSRGRLGVALSQYQDEYGIPKEEEAFIDLEQTRIDAEGVLERPFPGFETVKLRMGFNDYEHTEFEAPAEPGTRFSNDEAEGRLELVHAPLGDWRGVIGTQVIDRDFAAIGDEAFVPPVQTESMGLFVVEEREFRRGRVEVGARIEQVQQKPAAASGNPQIDFTPLSLAGGVMLDLNPDYHLRLNLARAQRAPAAEELYAFGPHLATGTFERGAAGLGEETSTNLELGVDKHQGRWTFEASVYYNPISNYIYLLEADENADGLADQVTPEGEPFVPGGGETGEEEGPLLLVDYSRGDATFTGFELQTAYALLQGPVALDLTLFADRVSARLDDGPDLPRITPGRLGLGLDAAWRGLQTQLDLTRVDGQDQVSTLETETGGYTLLSADLSYTLETSQSLSTTFYLRGRNLLDEEARRHTSFLKDVAPIAGTTLLAGVRFSL